MIKKTSPKLGEKPSKRRWFILFLVCSITFINYLDRANLAVAAPFLSKEFLLNPVQMGLIFSALSWSYTLMQIPSGWFLDRIGSKIVYGIALCGWSVFTMIMGITYNLTSTIFCRLGLGVFESPAFPANTRIVTTWFPSKERGLAIGAYTGSEYIGLALCTPILTWLLVTFGWRSIFIATGLLGITFSVIWFFCYNDPSKSKGVNKAEIDFIKEGGGLSDTIVEKKKVTWKEIKKLVFNRQLGGMYITAFANAAILFFFMTWFPSYLVNEKHMGILKVGIYGSLPYFAAIAGVIVAGKWSDWMISKGYGLGVSRKLPVILGLILSSVMIGSNYTNNVNIIITFMCIAFFGQGMASAISWALLSEIAPKELLGLSCGTYNFIANLGGALSPTIVGYLIARTGSYASALVFVSSMGIIGALSYIFIIGKPTRIIISD
ncbi:MFS transporter [Clostridium estertheticum]|uniref:MFS transporter n=1 Tax=Clostridium estertheticum TaxID=238834 RepID=UPI001C7D548B|nr:MFS transporter [Clostridium estertheticum]MBX4266876.1 MFS transporter [Clostridium estertheticum]MBX4271279.1 MFS transporter [Clostridium estertheticum]WLC81972.1 MFS transporter [Clostridium estertheticum]WLC90737.1 MFS transporter [Clostridium estertheticum]